MAHREHASLQEMCLTKQNATSLESSAEDQKTWISAGSEEHI